MMAFAARASPSSRRARGARAVGIVPVPAVVAIRTRSSRPPVRHPRHLGAGVLENAWAGYNCSLFAYGQTGSGKSYSMVGYGQNKGASAVYSSRAGIIPIACDELFKQIAAKKGGDTEYQVAR